MHRRQFLKAIGGTCASLPLISASLSELLMRESHQIPPLEEFGLSLCNACPNYCSLKVRKIGGKPVGISGNPLYPANRGHTCARGSALLEELYHPDRILRPLKRSGERGSGKFDPINWDEALAEIAANLETIRQKGPEHLAILRRETANSYSRLVSRFMRAFGSPNDVKLDTGYRHNPAVRLMQGLTESEGYDIENCSYVLCFGADFLNGGPAPVYYNGAFGRFRRGNTEARGRWVQVEPQLSMTGNNADQWIAIEPGTEAALALGIAYIIIKRGHYDADFIRRQTFGFEDWYDEKGNRHSGFKTLVLRDYSIYKVSQITGVPVNVIDQLAYEFATRKPALAIPGGHFAETSSGTYTKMAIHALNALVGSIDRPGGLLFQRPVPYTEFAEPHLDEVARKGLSMPRIDGAGSVFSPLAGDSPEKLPENLYLGKPYRLDMLMVVGGNPFYSFSDANKLRLALDNLPHLVCFTDIHDETSVWADIILPTTSCLEEWGDGTTPQGAPLLRTLGIRKPLSKPNGEARSVGDTLLALAQKMGGSCADTLAWKDYHTYLQESLAGVYKSGLGYIASGSFDVTWLKSLQKMGWRDPGCEDFDEFWEQLEKKGGWWDPVYLHGRWKEVFQTPSGKFEFYSLILNQASGRFGPEVPSVNPTSDLFCLPHYEEPLLAGESDEFPYVLLLYEPQHRRGDKGPALPTMQEMPSIPNTDIWGNRIEISREAAADLNVKEGDFVWVESPKGKIKLPVRIHSRSSKRAASIASGGGHTQLGRWAKGIGANPHELRPLTVDPISGAAALTCTRVKIYPA